MKAYINSNKRLMIMIHHLMNNKVLKKANKTTISIFNTTKIKSKIMNQIISKKNINLMRKKRSIKRRMQIYTTKRSKRQKLMNI